MEMVDDGGYGDAAPRIRDYLEGFEEVLSRVRATHCGRPASEVLSALEAEAAAVGVEVWREVAADAARVISECDPRG